MLETINSLLVHAADWVFGWILYLPRDLALFSVAVLTSASLTFVRKWTTDQEWLHRAVADEARQNQLRKEAKKRGDKEAVQRHKDVVTLIKMKSMRFEGKPLLWWRISLPRYPAFGTGRALGSPAAFGACCTCPRRRRTSTASRCGA